MKAYRGRRGVAPGILDISTRWRWEVNFTLRLLYLRQGTSVSIKWECEWAPEPARMFWRKEKFLAITGTPILEFSARSLVTMLTVLSRSPTYYVYFDVEDKCM